MEWSGVRSEKWLEVWVDEVSVDMLPILLLSLPSLYPILGLQTKLVLGR